MKNILYFSHINSIGGVETFYYYLVKKYKNRDITIYYKRGDPNQIKRLSKYVRVRRYTVGKIKCDKAIFNYSADIIDNVEANEYIQIIHADYAELRIRPNFSPKITKFIGVSKYICEKFKEYTGRDIELCYNPIEVDEPKKILHLISATRLTEEKGRDRMVKLANELDKNKILYTWTVFTNDFSKIDNPNIIFREPKLEIIPYIAESDYLVQLSDTEAYCYSVAEALCVGVPVIVTDCEAFKEIGVKDRVNGFVLKHDMENIPVNEIVEGLKPFTYKPLKDEWGKILAKGKSTYAQDEKVLVECISNYYDLQLDRPVGLREQLYMPNERADELVDLKLVKRVM